MADANANIRIGVDTSDALVQIKNLQRQISLFHSQMASSGKAAADQSARMQTNLVNSINATRGFTASMTRIKTTTESFTNALEKNKLSMGEYFRYAGGSTKRFGNIFKNEFNTIEKVARERVKDLQTQYIKLGRDAGGAMQAIKVRPTTLDMQNFGTQAAIAAQKTQLLNQLLKQGSTNLLNWGKNTQWAGRQLMVGFTVPLTIFGGIAAKTFMDLEEQAIRFKRVYGDMFTSDKEVDEALEGVRQLATEFTKFGVAVEDTIDLAASVAQMGAIGADLTNQVTEATRLAVLGGIEQQEALDTTISLTNAFGLSTDQLSGKIAFLNAVENQTILSIEDFNEAIPKAGSVVKQLGGDVEDLAYFLTAMREGGINASQSANALKSSLARLINPTEVAQEKLAGFGIDILGIVNNNAGNLRATIQVLAQELDKLDPLNKSRAIEQLFGKFQFARMSTLFENIVKEGSQANKTLELTTNSTEELAIIAERELGRVADSPAYKFKKALEEFQAALAPIGQAFLELATPVIEFGKRVLDQFNNLSDGAKQFIVGLTAVAGVIAPALIMVVGLIANGIANAIKFALMLRNAFGKSKNSSQLLTNQFEYMNQEQIEAAAVAASLDQVHSKLRQTFTSEAAAVDRLTAAYTRAVDKQRLMMMSGPRGGGPAPKKYNQGVVSVPGSGNRDTVPAMLTPGEAVIPKEMAAKYAPLIGAMVEGAIPGYNKGLFDFAHLGAGQQRSVADVLQMPDLVPTQSTKYAMEQLQRIDPNAPVNLKHSYGVAMDPSVNRALAKSGGAGLDDITKQFTGNNIEERYGEMTQLIGEDIGDGQLQKEFKNYDKAMSKKLKDLKKTGVTSIVDSEEQWKKLPKAQQKTTRSLESLDKEVVKDIGKENKNFVKARKKALGTVRDIRIGEGLTPEQRKKILEDPKASKALSRRVSSKGDARRVWISRQKKSRGGFGVMTQSQEYNDELADSAQTRSESKRTKKIAKDTVDGYANELKRGKKKVQQTAKEKAKLEEESRRRLYGGAQPTTQEKAARRQAEKKAKREAAEQRRVAKLRREQNLRMYGTENVTPEMRQARKRQEALEKQRRKVLKEQQKNNQQQTRIVRQEQVNAKKIGIVQRLKERAARREQQRLIREQAVQASYKRRMAGGGVGAGRMAGIGMAASSAVMMGSMAPGRVGEIANQLMMPTMALSMLLPMMTAKIGPLIAILGVLGAGIYSVINAFNKGAEEGQKMAEAFGYGQEAVRRFAKEAGNVTAGEIMDKRRETQDSVLNIQPGKATFGETFLQGDVGSELLDTVANTMKTSGSMQGVQQALVSQMGTAIASGALSAGQARSIVSEMSQELGNYQLGIAVNGELLELFGPDGENLLENPLEIRVRLIEASRENVERFGEQVGPSSAMAGLSGTAAAGVGGLAGGALGFSAAKNTGIGKAVGGGIAKVLAGAVGRTIGTTAAGAAAGPVGAIAGAVVGIGAGLLSIRNTFKDIGIQAGGFVASSIMALQQQQEMLDSLQIDYEKRIQIAEAAGDTAEAERLQNQYIEDRGALLEQNAITMESVMEGYRNAGFLGQRQIGKALDDQIANLYEDNPLMQASADLATQAIEKLDFGFADSEREFQLKLALAEGDISPDQVMGLLQLDDQTIDVGLGLITKLDGADAARAFNLMGMFVDKDGEPIEEMQTRFLANVNAAPTSTDAIKYLELWGEIKEVGEVADMQIVLDYYMNDPSGARRLSSQLNEVSRIIENSDGKLSIDMFANVYDDPEAREALMAYAEEFENLPPEMQLEFIETFTTVFNVKGDPEALEKYRTETGDMDATESERNVYQADRVIKDAMAQGDAGDLDGEDDESGGGGGGPAASELDDILKKLRDVRLATIDVTKGWQASRDKLEELFGDGRNIDVFDGMEQRMRGMGLGENLIDVIAGMPAEEYERRKNQLFTFDEAGNITGITKTLGNMQRAMNAVALGEFHNEQQSVISGLHDQITAHQKLTRAGLSNAQAYEAVKDKAFAAAIAREKDNDKIKESIKLMEEATEISRAYQAAESLARKNAETADLSGVANFIQKNAQKLSEAQKEAILSDKDLQTLVMNPEVDPDTLRQALKNAENQADLDLKIKKLTFEGLVDIFNTGFNNAMEAFSVKEKEIELDFAVKEEPFLEAIKEAEREIADIRNKAGGLDDLQAALERISWREEEINKKYEKREEALEQVRDLNKQIAAQQQSQLDVADALSRGDIAAAAKAVQEYRKQQTAASQERQSKQLEIAREKELAALVDQTGRNRVEIEQEIERLNRIIFEIEEQRIEPAQRQLELLGRQKEDLIAGLTVLGKTRQEWERVKNNVDLARISTDKFIKSMEDALDVVEDIVNYWDNFPEEKIVDITENVTRIYNEPEELPEAEDGALGAKDGTGGTTEKDTDLDTTDTASLARGRYAGDAGYYIPMEIDKPTPPPRGDSFGIGFGQYGIPTPSTGFQITPGQADFIQGRFGITPPTARMVSGGPYVPGGGGQPQVSNGSGLSGGNTSVGGMNGGRFGPLGPVPNSSIGPSLPPMGGPASLPPSLRGGSGSTAGRAAAGGAGGPLNPLRRDLTQLNNDIPNILSGVDEHFRTLPERTNSPIVNGIGGNFRTLGSRAPENLRGVPDYLKGPLAAQAEQGINEGIGGPLRRTGSEAPSYFTPLSSFFTSDLVDASSEATGRVLPDHLSSLGREAPSRLDPITGFFNDLPNTARPNIEDDLVAAFAALGNNAPLVLARITEFLMNIPSMPSVRGAIGIQLPALFLRAADLSIRMFRRIETYFRQLPGIIGRIISPISNRFAREGTESGRAFKRAVNREFNNFRPEVTITRRIITVYETQRKNTGGIVNGYNLGGAVAGFNPGGGFQNLPMGRRVPGSGSYDKVRTLLTPGEFVIRKEAVAKYGEGLMQMINSAKLPKDNLTIPTFDTGSGSSYSGNATAQKSGVMYNSNNYAINVNVKSEANPDQIARTVMNNIKRIDSQRIRSNRL